MPTTPDDARADATPRDDAAVLATALAHHAAGRLEAAEACYQHLLATDPGHAVAVANLAMLHHQRGALDMAATWYARALAVQRTPELLSNLATLRRTEGDLRSAIGLLTEALALRPGFPDALYNLGVTLIDADRPADAVVPLTQRARDPAAGADVHANLARVLYAIGRTPEALRHGRQALVLKDQQACLQLQKRGIQPLSRAAAPQFDPTRPERNVIAFSLWGTSATYVDGAIANAGLTSLLYPGWTCRIYLDASVPQAACAALAQEGAQLVELPQTGNHYGLFWRFLAADDADVDFFLCRDADARLNAQEAAAVAAWLRSGQPFHIMRDAPFHTELMLAGLWGGVGGRLRGIRAGIDQFYRPTAHRWIDQDFLCAEIWPRIRGQVLIYDSHYDLFDAQPFPPEGRLRAPNHVGAGYVLPESGNLSAPPSVAPLPSRR